MPPELAEVRRWIEKADRDHKTAIIAFQASPPITDTSAFHCQQAVEKLLKGYLVWRRIEFEKTYDLRALAELCATQDDAFLTHLDNAELLTAYAIRFRYPGPPDPTAEQVQRALEVVNEVRAFVLARLPAECRPSPDQAHDGRP